MLFWWTAFRGWWRERDAQQRRALFAVALLTLGAVAGVGFALGYLGAKHAVVWRIRDQATRLFDRIAPPSAALIARSTRATAFHNLEIARLPIGRASMLAQLDGHILFAAPNGDLSYLTGDRVVSLGISAPLGLDEFQRSALARHDTIDLGHIRVTDLLSIEVAPHTFDLFVAHIRFRDDCFRLVVNRTRLTATETTLNAASPSWEQVFETRDCIGMRPSGFPYLSPSSGGRLVRLGVDTVALSVGDFEFVGADLDRALSSDPNSDLGKIIELNLRTGRARVFARGLRNPQGLLVARDGSLWETEHGPEGGDELNLIRAGVDYGWPHVTYGTPYGGNLAPSWPAGAVSGEHGGYERPRFVFTPAIGISNLIEPDPREFPRWNHHLLVASLRGNALHLLRLEGDVVVFDEPIVFPGHRIRDLISLADGRIAFTTDEGHIFLVANADVARAHPMQVTGLDTLPPRPDAEWAAAYSGARLFAVHCAQCHALTGEVRGGPPLNGIVGRRVGGFDGYDYSPALSGRDQRWTPARLRAFLRDTERTFPGTRMPQPTNPGAIPAIVDYLAARRVAPTPMGAEEERQAGR